MMKKFRFTIPNSISTTTLEQKFENIHIDELEPKKDDENVNKSNHQEVSAKAKVIEAQKKQEISKKPESMKTVWKNADREIKIPKRRYQSEPKPQNGDIDLCQLYRSMIKLKDPIVMYSNLKIRQWPKAKNIKVKMLCIVQEPNIIAFCEDKVIVHNFYEYIQKEIKCYVDSIKDKHLHYLPKNSEIILGRFEQSWYRAVVINSKEYGVIVQFIDHGNMNILQPSEILSVTEKLAFEVCMREFIVDNLTSNLNEKQQEILASETMMITNIYKDKDGIHHCEIYGF